MKRLTFIPILLTVFLIISACAPLATPASQPTQVAPEPTQVPTPTPVPTQPSGDQLPPFMPAVEQFAAEKLNAQTGQVKLMRFEPVTWPDSCLGAAQPGEFCTQVITPGYRVTVDIDGTTYELHTNGSDQVRLANTATPVTDIPPAAEAARLWLVDQLKIDINTIKVISVTPETWPDGCMGVHKANQMCASVIVPGYRVILEVNGQNMELRTNQDGKSVVLADPMLQISKPQFPSLATPQITWKNGGTNCFLLQVREDKAAFGACGGKLTLITIANPERIKELAAMIALYSTFSAQTPAGQVAYYGYGTAEATPAQQRAVAEWAQMLYLEVSSPAPAVNLGLALTWQRVGGIAGFCDDLKIYRSGLAVATTCKASADQPPRKIWLNADQLVQMYTWLDTLQTSDGKQSDSAVANSMTVTWTLSANGNRKPTYTEEQKIMEFASTIFLSK